MPFYKIVNNYWGDQKKCFMLDLPECSSKKALEPRRDDGLDDGLDVGCWRETADRPVPIDARLRPEAGVGVGGKVAPLVTELRDSLLLRLLPIES